MNAKTHSSLVLFRACREARVKSKQCPAYAAKPDTYLESLRTLREVPTKPDRLSRTSHRPTMTAGHFAPVAKSHYSPLHYARTPRNPKAITGPLRACRGVPVEPDGCPAYIAETDSTCGPLRACREVPVQLITLCAHAAQTENNYGAAPRLSRSPGRARRGSRVHRGDRQ